jgi:hypothetical protein
MHDTPTNSDIDAMQAAVDNKRAQFLMFEDQIKQRQK